MSVFPRLPQIRGDTDDDASIHLYSRVGPARPILKRAYDSQIKDLLSIPLLAPVSDDAAERDPAETLNKEFYDFAQSSASDSDDTRVEVPKTAPRRRSLRRVLPDEATAKPAGSATPYASSREYVWLTRLVVFLVSAFLLSAVLGVRSAWGLHSGTAHTGPAAPSEVTAKQVHAIHQRLGETEARMDAFADLWNSLDKQVDVLGRTQSGLQDQVLHRLAAVEGSVQALVQTLAGSEARAAAFDSELAQIREAIDGLRAIGGDPATLERRLGAISEKLQTLNRLSTDMAAIKDSIVAEFLRQLPSHVPVYVEDKKVHYLPEFRDFLQSFVDHRLANRTLWLLFMAENGAKLDARVAQLAKTGDHELMTRDEFRAVFARETEALDGQITARFNQLLSTLDLRHNTTHVDVSRQQNRIVLDNLVDLVSKGAVKTNFADYKLGARILGFLTTTGKDLYRPRLLVRLLFLGWFDYLTSQGLTSPELMKYNANNLLVTSNTYWQCELLRCSVGIRLASAVILTDLLLENPSYSRPAGLVLPSSVAVYIKPRNPRHAQVLEEYSRAAGFLMAGAENKYLRKFYKVHEAAVTSSVQHIAMPATVLNMRVPLRDLYLELRTRDGVTGLCSVKAYGLTEDSAFRFTESFESILDHMVPDPEPYPTSVLGEDD